MRSWSLLQLLQREKRDPYCQSGERTIQGPRLGCLSGVPARSPSSALDITWLPSSKHLNKLTAQTNNRKSQLHILRGNVKAQLRSTVHCRDRSHGINIVVWTQTRSNLTDGLGRCPNPFTRDQESVNLRS